MNFTAFGKLFHVDNPVFILIYFKRYFIPRKFFRHNAMITFENLNGSAQQKSRACCQVRLFSFT